MKISWEQRNVGVVVRVRRPEAQDVRAVFVNHLGGVHAVSGGFVHGLALAVHRPAVGDALLEGSPLAQRAHGGEQGGLEPAPVLVQALQIEVGGVFGD